MIRGFRPAGVPYGSHDVLKDADLRQGVKDFTCAQELPLALRRRCCSSSTRRGVQLRSQAFTCICECRSCVAAPLAPPSPRDWPTIPQVFIDGEFVVSQPLHIPLSPLQRRLFPPTGGVAVTAVYLMPRVSLRVQGGSDILMSMHQNGELEKLLKAAPEKKQ